MPGEKYNSVSDEDAVVKRLRGLSRPQSGEGTLAVQGCQERETPPFRHGSHVCLGMAKCERGSEFEQKSRAVTEKLARAAAVNC